MSSGTPTTPQALTAAEALEVLRAGNRRFVDGAPRRGDASPERRAQLTAGQTPHSAVLCCSDSRVPPKIIFDQGLGGLFVVRTAGNVLDAVALGSLEYAVDHLHVPVAIVLGHDGCGAVTAACSHTPGGASGALESVLCTLDPAVEADPTIADALAKGSFRVVGARCHLASGEVTFI